MILLPLQRPLRPSGSPLTRSIFLSWHFLRRRANTIFKTACTFLWFFLPESTISRGSRKGLVINAVFNAGKMNTEISSSQLFRACHVLFGSGIDVSDDFLRYLRMPGLKAAYRDRALATHPDRAAVLACLPADLEERFKGVNTAYRSLHNYLENPWRFNLGEDSFGQAPCRPAGRSSYSRAGAHAKRTGPSQEGAKLHKFNGTLSKKGSSPCPFWKELRNGFAVTTGNSAADRQAYPG